MAECSIPNIEAFSQGLIRTITDCYAESQVSHMDILLVDFKDWASLVIFCLTHFKWNEDDSTLFCYLDSSKLSSLPSSCKIHIKFHIIHWDQENNMMARISGESLTELICVHAVTLSQINDINSFNLFKKEFIGTRIYMYIVTSLISSD